MLLENERKLIIAYSLKALKDGLTNGTSGNISIYNREKNLIAISPTGVPYDELKVEQVSVIEIDGKMVEGLKPSSEWYMHLQFYKRRSDINSVFHGHTTYATTIACLRKDLPPIDYMIAVCGQNTVKCAKYATFGTKELADNAWEAGKDSKAVLLANHGLLTYSNSIESSYSIAIQIEYIAKLYVNVLQTGVEPVLVDEKEMTRMHNLFKTYGKQD